MGPIALGGVGLVVVFMLLRTFVPGVLVALGTPLWISGNTLSAGVGTTASFFSDTETLIAERDALRDEVAALQVTVQTTQARADDLQRLLGSRTEPVGEIVAGVLARPPVSPYDLFVLDQGDAAGVTEGARVHGAGGVPIGVIESVSTGTSRARLYSTPGQETEGWVGDERIPVSLVGEGAGALRAEVAREAGVVPGALVYVAGPGALPLGTVIHVENDPTLPRSRVDIRPLVNPFSVTWVTIAP